MAEQFEQTMGQEATEKGYDPNMSMADLIRAEYLGLPLAILCARYWYRGIVSRVGKDWVTLSYVRAVEVTGPANAEVPTTEDIVPSDMTISSGAIEQICQPHWVWAGLADVIKPPKEIADQIEMLKKQAEKEERENAKKAAR